MENFSKKRKLPLAFLKIILFIIVGVTFLIMGYIIVNPVNVYLNSLEPIHISKVSISDIENKYVYYDGVIGYKNEDGTCDTYYKLKDGKFFSHTIIEFKEENAVFNEKEGYYEIDFESDFEGTFRLIDGEYDFSHNAIHTSFGLMEPDRASPNIVIVFGIGLGILGLYFFARAIKVIFSKIKIKTNSSQQKIYTKNQLKEIIKYKPIISNTWFTDNAILHNGGKFFTQINYNEITSISNDRVYGHRGAIHYEIKIIDKYDNIIVIHLWSEFDELRANKLAKYLNGLKPNYKMEILLEKDNSISHRIHNELSQILELSNIKEKAFATLAELGCILIWVITGVLIFNLDGVYLDEKNRLTAYENGEYSFQDLGAYRFYPEKVREDHNDEYIIVYETKAINGEDTLIYSEGKAYMFEWQAQKAKYENKELEIRIIRWEEHREEVIAEPSYFSDAGTIYIDGNISLDEYIQSRYQNNRYMLYFIILDVLFLAPISLILYLKLSKKRKKSHWNYEKEVIKLRNKDVSDYEAEIRVEKEVDFNKKAFLAIFEPLILSLILTSPIMFSDVIMKITEKLSLDNNPMINTLKVLALNTKIVLASQVFSFVALLIYTLYIFITACNARKYLFGMKKSSIFENILFVLATPLRTIFLLNLSIEHLHTLFSLENKKHFRRYARLIFSPICIFLLVLGVKVFPEKANFEVVENIEYHIQNIYSNSEIIEVYLLDSPRSELNFTDHHMSENSNVPFTAISFSDLKGANNDMLVEGLKLIETKTMESLSEGVYVIIDKDLATQFDDYDFDEDKYQDNFFNTVDITEYIYRRTGISLEREMVNKYLYDLDEYENGLYYHERFGSKKPVEPVWGTNLMTFDEVLTYLKEYEAISKLQASDFVNFAFLNPDIIQDLPPAFNIRYYKPLNVIVEIIE